MHLKKDDERRITEILLAYWNKRRGDRLFPSPQEINPKDLTEIWDNCFMIRLVSDPEEEDEFRYTYLGSSIVAAYGDNLTGADIYTSLMSPSGARIADIFDKVATSKKPLVESSEFLNTQNVIIRYRQCVLPLGEKEDEVTHLIGGMRWSAG